MIRSLMLSVLGVWLLVGCGDTHRPVVRAVPDSANDEQAASAESPEMPAAASQTEVRLEAGGELKVGSLRFAVPKGWVQKQPRSGFVLAEFGLPRAQGDAADGRLTISTAGGTVQQNVERWKQQFGGKPQKESQKSLQVEGVQVTLVDFSGSFLDQRGPSAPAEEHSGYRMFGAIIPVGSQSYFVKAYGPEKTMAARADEFQKYIRSVKSSAPSR